MEVAVSSLVQQELLVFKQMERLTYDLGRRPDYNALSVFRCIDRADDGRIDIVSLDRFFRRNGLFYQERELIALVRRIDTTADQTISYQELQDFLHEQIGFRSISTSKGLYKATPTAKRVIHEDLVDTQLRSVKKVPIQSRL